MQPKFIPCGGPGGNHVDITTPSKKLVSVEVWSDDCDHVGGGVINGISFTYKNDKEQLFSAGPWGSKTGNHHKVRVVRTCMSNVASKFD
jgi:hypothetical protein